MSKNIKSVVLGTGTEIISFGNHVQTVHHVLAYNAEWGEFIMNNNNTSKINSLPESNKFNSCKPGDVILCSREHNQGKQNVAYRYTIEKFVTLENIKNAFLKQKIK